MVVSSGAEVSVPVLATQSVSPVLALPLKVRNDMVFPDELALRKRV